MIIIKKILLLGLGKSNRSIEVYLKKYNYSYEKYDDFIYFKKIKAKDYYLIIKSNGIKQEHNIIQDAIKNNIKIISDLEFYYLVTGINDSIMCTGSNGKTTIVSLLEKCLNNAVAIGNNGLAFFDYINDFRYKIIEASSFMLENTYKTKYKYNVITNIYNTHLEHHKSYVNYIKSKLSFLKRLDTSDIVVYNADDLLLNRIVNSYEFRKISVSKNDNADIYLKDNYIYFKNDKYINIKNLNIIGEHNIYNIMLLLGILLNHPLTKEDFINEIYNFKGVKYRMELIYDNECVIYNDSKSTNYMALNSALSCFKDNVILICGGQYRDDEISILDKHLNKLDKVYCFGENKNIFFKYFNNNNKKCFKFSSLDEVVKNLKDYNDKIILFSPGSVSFDQFSDFEHRGEVFNYLISTIFNLKKLS